MKIPILFSKLSLEATDDVQINPHNEPISEESEIETDFDFKTETVPRKRKVLEAQSNHMRRKTLLQKFSQSLPSTSCPKSKDPEFESSKLLPNRKKIQIKYSKRASNIVELEKSLEAEPFTILTDDTMKSARLRQDQFSEYPMFNDYDPGIMSNKLYVKNLSKTVTESDLKSIFHRHILDSTEEVDIRLFTLGKLKGQCFVTFNLFENPLKRREAEKLIEKARKEAHGFILKRKPMFVVYGKYQNKLG
ncbi:unnamed protein product [Diamesa serratosioi]